MEIPEKVREKLRALPNKPGCYMMRDRAGTIIYVGKAISLRKRVQSYFRESPGRTQGRAVFAGHIAADRARQFRANVC